MNDELLSQLQAQLPPTAGWKAFIKEHLADITTLAKERGGTVTAELLGTSVPTLRRGGVRVGTAPDPRPKAPRPVMTEAATPSPDHYWEGYAQGMLAVLKLLLQPKGEE